jgi:hypothetical protein
VNIADPPELSAADSTLDLQEFKSTEEDFVLLLKRSLFIRMSASKRLWGKNLCFFRIMGF